MSLTESSSFSYQPPKIVPLGCVRDLLVAHLNQLDPGYRVARSAIALLRDASGATPILRPFAQTSRLNFLGARPFRVRPRSCGWAARLFREIVDFHHGNVKVTMADPCAAAGVSERNVSRHFRQVYKEKPGQYHLRVRREWAEHLLRTRPELSIEDVGSQLGYEEAGDFSKFFRRQSGMTPRDYRTYSQSEFLLAEMAS